VVADLPGLEASLWAIAMLTFISGTIVQARMQETLNAN
jgi:hypothetical protein